MTPPQESDAPLVSVREARERAIAHLSEAFAHDMIGVDEFEQRLTLVHRADTASAIAGAVSDLAPRAPEAAATSALAPVRTATEGPDSDRLMAVLAGVERRGAWTVPRRLKATAVLGGMVLDFRDAAFPPGVTEVHVTGVMGGVNIIVPPNLSVEVSGSAVLGGFGHVERLPGRLDPDSPVLRVRGFAVLGGVAVETRLPGESDADAARHRARRAQQLGDGRSLPQLPEKAGR